MALIEVFHVTASNVSISPNVSTDIPQGLLVQLSNTHPYEGEPERCDGDSTTQMPFGIAGDSRSTGTTSYSAESGSALSRDPKNTLEGALITGAYGIAQRYTQNRVADGYNEVMASGKMTIYHSGGEFWTDQYEIVESNGTTLCSYFPGLCLFASGVESSSTIIQKNVNLESETSQMKGRFTDEVPSSNAKLSAAVGCGVMMQTPTAYPSGVPGTDTGFTTLPEGGNSLTFGNFIHVKLLL